MLPPTEQKHVCVCVFCDRLVGFSACQDSLQLVEPVTRRQMDVGAEHFEEHLHTDMQ